MVFNYRKQNRRYGIWSNGKKAIIFGARWSMDLNYSAGDGTPELFVFCQEKKFFGIVNLESK